MKYGTYVGLVSALSHIGLEEDKNAQFAFRSNDPEVGDTLELSIHFACVHNSTTNEMIKFSAKLKAACDFVKTVNEMGIIIEDWGGKIEDQKFITAYEVGGFRELTELIDEVNFHVIRRIK